MIYLDSSAILKLVRGEAETGALLAWLGERSSEALVSSALARVEVIRAAGRVGDHVAVRARVVLTNVDLVRLSDAVLDLAQGIGGPGLRTPDAIHLASAAMVGDAVISFVAYDHRLADAAAAHGMPVEIPS